MSQTPSSIPSSLFGVESSLATAETEGTLNTDRLVLPYLPLVRSIASRMRMELPPHIELDELISAGMLGLVDALNKFDPTKDTKLENYARFRIRGTILDFLRSLDWAPREVRKKKRSIDSSVRALTIYLGREPSEEEVATASDLSLDEYRSVLTDSTKATLLSTTIAENADGIEGNEVQIAAPCEDEPLHQCIQNETRERIAMALDGLPERERLVLTLYYYEELTMKEIGEVLGVAPSRISQLHSATLKRLRIILKSL